MLPEEFDLVVRRLIALGAPKDAQLSIPAIIGLNKIYCLWGYTLSWCFIRYIKIMFGFVSYQEVMNGLKIYEVVDHYRLMMTMGSTIVVGVLSIYG